MTKKLTIKNFFRISGKNTGKREMELTGDEDMEVSDGFHTMGELYEHRITLFIALLKTVEEYRRMHEGEFGSTGGVAKLEAEGLPWRSKLHSDGSSFDGWFILGLGKKKGEQITYHLPLSKWSECDFAETLDQAPEWDGHTSGDVLERLKQL